MLIFTLHIISVMISWWCYSQEYFSTMTFFNDQFMIIFSNNSVDVHDTIFWIWIWIIKIWLNFSVNSFTNRVIFFFVWFKTFGKIPKAIINWKLLTTVFGGREGEGVILITSSACWVRSEKHTKRRRHLSMFESLTFLAKKKYLKFFLQMRFLTKTTALWTSTNAYVTLFNSSEAGDLRNFPSSAINAFQISFFRRNGNFWLPHILVKSRLNEPPDLIWPKKLDDQPTSMYELIWKCQSLMEVLDMILHLPWLWQSFNKLQKSTTSFCQFC